MSFLGLILDFEERGHEPVHIPHCMHLLKSNPLRAVSSSISILLMLHWRSVCVRLDFL